MLPALALVGIVAAVGLAYVVMSGREEPTPEFTRFTGLNPTFTQLTSQSGEELFPSLSPDGRTLVYASMASGNWDIYSRRVGGETVINLTEDSTETDSQPSLSRDGEFIAFRSAREGGGIFVMGATGENVRQVTDFGFNPVWSPDGTEVLFAVEGVYTDPQSRGSTSQLWTIDVETEEARQVFEGDAVQPQWSPHGNRIAYWSQIGGQRDIWTIAADGSEPVALTNDAALDWNPVWSPDGNYLYFSSNRSGGMNLWRVWIDETSGMPRAEPEAITVGAAGANMHLSISEDGKRMVYATQDLRQNIMKVDFDPSTNAVIGEPVFVTEGSMSDITPDVSADGASLVFRRTVGQEDLFTVRSDGTGLRQLTNDLYNDRAPEWSPDGRKIAFYSSRSGSWQLWTINPDGSSPRQLTDVAQVIYVTWSPDSARIAYSDFRTASFIVESTASMEDQGPLELPPLPVEDEFFVVRSWSPDGKWLAGVSFSGRRASSVGLYVYSFESNQYEQLNGNETAREPHWLADSQTLLYHDDGGIHSVNRVSKEVRDVMSIGPGDGAIFQPTTSPDDETLYYVSLPPVEADIWLIELPNEPQ